MRLNAIRLFMGLAVVGLLASCEDEPPPVPEQMRPIRVFTITDVASGQVRNFSAVIAASDSSSLSFQIAGNVREVKVSQGDQVTRDQVLAVLDQEPFRLNVRAAEANHQAVRAELTQQKAEFDR